MSVRPLLIALCIFAASFEVEGMDMEASWYGGKFQGRLMANGQRYDTNGMTCAGNLWPLGTILVVTTDEGRTCRPVVTDRIARRFSRRRVDLSPAAFQKLAPLSTGIVRVETLPVSLRARQRNAQ